jgi:hypothetical protein
MNLELTDEEAAALLRELNVIIDGDRYFLSQRIKTLKAIRAKIRPDPVREPLPPPPRQYAPPASDSQAETTRRTLSGPRNRRRAPPMPHVRAKHAGVRQSPSTA